MDVVSVAVDIVVDVSIVRLVLAEGAFMMRAGVVVGASVDGGVDTGVGVVVGAGVDVGVDTGVGVVARVGVVEYNCVGGARG